jgi:hypothetical protein
MKFKLPQHRLSEAFFNSLSDGSLPTPSYPTSKGSRPQNLAYLFQLAVRVGASKVIEIGTGASTRVLISAGVRSIWTCDRSGDFRIPGAQVFNCTSTAMLETLTEIPELYFFDGRVMEDDVPHIERLSNDATWFCFDDFHGLEKGVANAMRLYSRDRFLMVPVDGPLGRSTFAVLAPVSQLAFSVYA